jgi:hypothetical protein
MLLSRTKKARLQAEQFLANWDAMERHSNCPPVEVIDVLPDRMLFRWTDEWDQYCEDRMVPQDAGIEAHKNFPGYSLAGFRDAKYSVLGKQVIKRRGEDGTFQGEADLDWGVPTDLVGVITHLVKDFLPNKLRGKRMNQFAAMRYMRRRRGWRVTDVRVRG